MSTYARIGGRIPTNLIAIRGGKTAEFYLPTTLDSIVISNPDATATGLVEVSEWSRHSSTAAAFYFAVAPKTTIVWDNGFHFQKGMKVITSATVKASISFTPHP